MGSRKHPLGRSYAAKPYSVLSPPRITHSTEFPGRRKFHAKTSPGNLKNDHSYDNNLRSKSSDTGSYGSGSSSSRSLYGRAAEKFDVHAEHSFHEEGGYQQVITEIKPKKDAYTPCMCNCNRKTLKSKPVLTCAELQHLLRMFLCYCRTEGECCNSARKGGSAFEKLQLTASQLRTLKSIYKLYQRGGCVNMHAVNQKSQALNLTADQILQIKAAYKDYCHCHPCCVTEEWKKCKLSVENLPMVYYDTCGVRSPCQIKKSPCGGTTACVAGATPHMFPECGNPLAECGCSIFDDCRNMCDIRENEPKMIADAIKQLIQELKGMPLDCAEKTVKKVRRWDPCKEPNYSSTTPEIIPFLNAEYRKPLVCAPNSLSDNVLLKRLQGLKNRLLLLQQLKRSDALQGMGVCPRSAVKRRSRSPSPTPCEPSILKTRAIDKLRNILGMIENFKARPCGSLVASEGMGLPETVPIGPKGETPKGKSTLRVVTKAPRPRSLTPPPNQLEIEKLDPRFRINSIPPDDQDHHGRIPLTASHDKRHSDGVRTILLDPGSRKSIRDNQQRNTNITEGNADALNKGRNFRVRKDKKLLGELARRVSEQDSRQDWKLKRKMEEVEEGKPGSTKRTGQATFDQIKTTTHNNKVNESRKTKITVKPVSSDDSDFVKSSAGSKDNLTKATDHTEESVHYLYSRGQVPNPIDPPKTVSRIIERKIIQRNVKNKNYLPPPAPTATGLLINQETNSFLFNPESVSSTNHSGNPRNYPPDNRGNIPGSNPGNYTPRTSNHPTITPYDPKRGQHRPNLPNGPYDLMASNYQAALPPPSQAPRFGPPKIQMSHPPGHPEATDIVTSNAYSFGDRDQTERHGRDVRGDTLHHHHHHHPHGHHAHHHPGGEGNNLENRYHLSNPHDNYSHSPGAEYGQYPPPDSSEPHHYSYPDDRSNLHHDAYGHHGEHHHHHNQHGNSGNHEHNIGNRLEIPLPKSNIPMHVRGTNLSDDGTATNMEVHHNVSRKVKVTGQKETTDSINEVMHKINKGPETNQMIPGDLIRLPDQIVLGNPMQTYSNVTHRNYAPDQASNDRQEILKRRRDSHSKIDIHTENDYDGPAKHRPDPPMYNSRLAKEIFQNPYQYQADGSRDDLLEPGPHHHIPRPTDQVPNQHGATDVRGAFQRLPPGYGTSMGPNYEMDKSAGIHYEDISTVVTEEVIHEETRYEEETQTEEPKKDISPDKCMECCSPFICDRTTYQTKLPKECFQLDLDSPDCSPLLIMSAKNSFKDKSLPNRCTSKPNNPKTIKNQSNHPLGHSLDITAHRIGFTKRTAKYVCCPLTPKDFFPAITAEGENIMCLDYKTLKRATQILKTVDPTGTGGGCFKSKRRRRLQKLTIKTDPCCTFSIPTIPGDHCPPSCACQCQQQDYLNINNMAYQKSPTCNV